MRFKRLTITIEGIETGDLELSMEEVQRLITEGCTSGFNHNETASFNFDIDEYAEEKQLNW